MLIAIRHSTGELLLDDGTPIPGLTRADDAVSVRSDAPVALRFYDDAGNRVTLTPATGTLTFAGQPANGDTFTVGPLTYTVAADGTGAAYTVAHGANLAAFIANLVGAVNLSTANGQAAGTTYGTNTAANPAATATVVSGSTILFTARRADASGNAVATSEACSVASFGAATLSGGEVPSFDLKAAGKFDENFVLASPVFAAPLDPTAGDYTATLDTNTDEAIALLDPNNQGGTTPTNDEPYSVPLMAQVRWAAAVSPPPRPRRSGLWTVNLANSVEHGGEGVPTSANGGRYDATDAQRLAGANGARTFLSGDLVRVTDQGNRLEMFLGGNPATDANWLVLRNTVNLTVINQSDDATINNVLVTGTGTPVAVGWVDPLAVPCTAPTGNLFVTSIAESAQTWSVTFDNVSVYPAGAGYTGVFPLVAVVPPRASITITISD